jgi:hypothetical protein
VDAAAQAGVEVKVLLLGPEGITTAETVGVINEVTGRSVTLERVSTEDYARRMVAGDEGGKDEGFFRNRLSWFEALEKGGWGGCYGDARGGAGEEAGGGEGDD